MSLRGLLLVWVGLMGLAAAAIAWVLLRLFPGAFSDSGPAVAQPWQRDAGRQARFRGWLVAAAFTISALTGIAGLMILLL